ncbi:MAG: hypothetical protein P1U56_16970 [Saprospiraceae bacterium]|nr:hypothetical protein [Saprospiraceae bacterium]
MIKRQICAMLFTLIFVNSMNAQTGYTIFSIGGELFLYSIDLNTCEICQLTNGISFSDAAIGSDLTMLPNGNWISHGGCNIVVMSPPPNSSVLFETPFSPDPCIQGSVYDELNDIVYLIAQVGLYTFDPVTFTITLVGTWPPTWNNPNMNGIHFTNGVLYGTASFTPGGYQLFEIDINDPSNSTILFNVPVISGQGSSINGYYYTVSGIFGEFDIATQSATPLCGPYDEFNYATIDVPTFSLPDYDCIINCDTDAGQVTDLDPIVACVSEPVSINPAIDTELEADDVLQYILFTDLNDTLGTIIATSNTPDFIFDPSTMVVGVTYYITSTAADDDGTGNTDFTDPCFDIGTNAQAIEWVAEPTVTFTVANNDICENGCKEINATFTGIPPFTLTYQVGGGAEVIEIFNTTNGNFEICIGAETGSIDLMATALSDAVCCGN